MAVETYGNAASTTLTAGYTAGAGSITVASTAAPFPQSPNLRLAVFDQSTGALKVILKATAVTDGTHWAVTAEGTDANAASGDIVRHCLTAGGMDGIRADLQQFGTFASLPSTTGQKQGNRYKCTDAPFDYIFNGSAWQGYFKGLPVTPIIVGDWSTLGSGGTRNDGAGCIQVIGKPSATNTVYGVSRTVAAGDFTKYILACFKPNRSLNHCLFGGYTDGTKVEGFGTQIDATDGPAHGTGLSATALTSGTYAAATGLTSAFSPTVGAGAFLLFKLTRTGTALRVDVSFDFGLSFDLGFNDTSPFLTASSVAVWADPRTTSSAIPGSLTLLAYS